MIRIALVEDDDNFITQMKDFLSAYEKEQGESFAVTVYHDGDEIVADYRQQFDIILMDIAMKFVDGMTAAEEIRKIDSEVIIIFITNLPQYAIRGYEVEALDYILKPLSYFSFSQKLGHAISRMHEKDRQFVVIPFRSGTQRMDVADIYYIESYRHTLIYHTSQGELYASGTMKAAEDSFSKYHFSRANKGYLINLECVDQVVDKCAVVRGEKLPISRSKMNDFMMDLTNYWAR